MIQLGQAALEYRRLRAPSAHGLALVDPPLAAVESLVAANAKRSRRTDIQLAGLPLDQVAHDARRSLIDLATQYTSQYMDPPAADPESPLILAGHQPQLMHAGVWFKNFVLDFTAQRCHARGINLIIDNDAVRSTTVRVPTGSVDNPRIESVAFDRTGAAIPYELRDVEDHACFESFGTRASAAISPLVANPLIDELWPLAIEALETTPNLGGCIARARHRMEAELGLRNLEVPLSRICDTESFFRFSLELLANAARLRELYNDALAEYRRVHRIRSRSHPAAELEVNDDYVETPFWIWTTEHPRRRPLYVRSTAGQLHLCDRAEISIRVPVADGQLDSAVELLIAQSAAGVKLRPRAMMTTMFARLLLGDLFIHGIGGAKYDQLTDLLIARFFGINATDFMVVSATMMLPIDRPQVDPEDLKRIDQRLRDLRFHPETCLGPDSELEHLVKEKRDWITREPSASDRKTRHQRLGIINRQLADSLQPLQQKLIADRQRTATLLRHQARLNSREFAFCLFPRETLVRNLLELLEKDL